MTAEKISNRIKILFYVIYTIIGVFTLYLALNQSLPENTKAEMINSDDIPTILNTLFVLVPIIFTYTAEKTLDHCLLKHDLIGNPEVESIQIDFKFKMGFMATISVIIYLIMLLIKIGFFNFLLSLSLSYLHLGLIVISIVACIVITICREVYNEPDHLKKIRDRLSSSYITFEKLDDKDFVKLNIMTKEGVDKKDHQIGEMIISKSEIEKVLK